MNNPTKNQKIEAISIAINLELDVLHTDLEENIKRIKILTNELVKLTNEI